MADPNGHNAATMYFIAGMRGALAQIHHDARILTAVADAMERNGGHLSGDDQAALQTAARWMRGLDAVDHAVPTSSKSNHSTHQQARVAT
jgi:hypothetical protein